MITLHEILYSMSHVEQKVTVTVRYDETPGERIVSQKIERFTGRPRDLMRDIDSRTLKHLACVDGVEDGVIQITSRPMKKLNKYKAYYTAGPVCKNADIIDVEEFKAVNLNDALNQAQSYFRADSDRKLIGINLIEGIG